MWRSVFSVVLMTAAAINAQEKKTQVQVTENLSVSDSVEVNVSRAISRWQNENNIKVAGDAQNLIKAGFDDNSELNAGLAKRGTQERGILVRAMVENYLFDVRDDAILKRSTKGPTLPLKTVSFQLEGRNKPPILDKIDVPDIAHLPVLDFIKRKISEWKEYASRKLTTWEEVPVGYLHIMSSPDGAKITLNNKDAGFTCKKLVEIPQRYEVTILPASGRFCQQSVTVVSNWVTYASCDKIVKCSNWKVDEP